jgi:hypothetical protein
MSWVAFGDFGGLPLSANRFRRIQSAQRLFEPVCGRLNCGKPSAEALAALAHRPVGVGKDAGHDATRAYQ